MKLSELSSPADIQSSISSTSSKVDTTSPEPQLCPFQNTNVNTNAELQSDVSSSSSEVDTTCPASQPHSSISQNRVFTTDDNHREGVIEPPGQAPPTDQYINAIDEPFLFSEEPSSSASEQHLNSMEGPFFSAARYHPPFICPKQDCPTCKNLKNKQKNISVMHENIGSTQTIHGSTSTPPLTHKASDFFESNNSDPPQAERSIPQIGFPSYFENVQNGYVTYPGTLPHTRPEPNGVLYPPCKPLQKAEWFVRTHDFQNGEQSSGAAAKNSDFNQEDNGFDFSPFFSSLFYICLSIFYMALGSNFGSLFSQIVLSFMALSHIGSLYIFNIEVFHFYYNDCLQAILVHIGKVLEYLFDSVCCSFYKITNGYTPPPYMYNLYKTLYKKYDKRYPRLFYRPLKTLRIIIKAITYRTLEFFYLAAFHYPKMNISVSKKDLHNVNLRGLPQTKVKQFFPNPINKGIPITFQNGLPFVQANINGTFVKFLVDTGSKMNIINSEVINNLKKNFVNFTEFEHKISLSGHSGQPLNIEKNAVNIPVQFMGAQNMFLSSPLKLPFLVENNPQAVSILGMNSLRELNITCSKGFRHLFLKLNENTSQIGYPSEGLSYPGTINPTCDANQDSFLDIRFQDLDSYTGCVLLSNSFTPHSDHMHEIEKLNGHYYHIIAGRAKIRSPFKHGYNHTGTIQVSGTVRMCTHPDPGGNETLASLIDTLGYAPGLVDERRRDLEQDSDLFNKMFSSNTLNNMSEDPDADPDPALSPLFDWDLQNPLNKNIIVPSKNELSASTNVLEIQIKDHNNECFICLENKCDCSADSNIEFNLCEPCSKCICSPNPSAEQNLKHLKKKRPRIFINHNIVTLYAFKPADIYKNLFALSKLIIHMVPNKNFDDVRLGRTLGSFYGTKIYSKLSHSLEKSQEGCPETPITLIPTAKSTEVHALEFDVQKGELVHRPLLMNDYIGLEDDLLQPPEITYIHDEYIADLTEVIKNSSNDLASFLNATFSTYDRSYIRSPTDYGELELDTFRLDLELKPETEHLLPKHKPFSTSAHLTKVVDKICNFWTTIKLAQPSEVTSHASRLLVVTKKVSQRTFEKIKVEVESTTNYQFRSNNPTELYSLDPDLLSVKNLNSIYRVCLDSRDLNRITGDMVQRSQNPETTLYNLMMSIGGADSSTTKKYTWADFRESDPFKNTKFSAPDPDYSFIENLIKSNNFSQDKQYYYSTLDISSAHTSIPLTDRAKFLLNFITPSLKILNFTRGVFGLKNISSQFNGSLCRILEDLISLGLVHCYADDIILICKHKETHLALIAEIARRFQNHGLKMSLNKSNFGVDKFTYLGFVFDQNGIGLSQDRINSITNFPVPRDLKGVQRFIGCINYIQRFIPQYSFNLFPITLLLSEKEFFWRQEQQQAFDNIKAQISKNLLLHYVPPRTQLHLFVDASLVAGGGVLFCGVPNTDSYRPILYMSKKFSDHEIRRHSALESEMNNLLYCLEKTSYFFSCLDSPVIVHTDAKTILYLIFGARKTSNPKLSRLALKLSHYLVNFSINYTPPKCAEMVIADCLSRQYYNMVPKLPGDLVKSVKKEDISLPSPGVYNFEQLDNWVDSNEVVNLENYPEKVIRLHQIKDQDQDPDHFSLIHLIDRDRLCEYQRKDEFVANIFKDFSPKEILQSSPKNGYLFRNNLLYVQNKIEPLFPKVYIPDSLLPTVVAGAHISYNHIGAHKHYELMKSLVFNPNLKKVVFDLISKCHLCAVVNSDTNRKGIITKTRFPDFPGQSISIDFMSVPKDHGFEAILVICDLFSNFCVLEACKDQSTDSAIKALERAFRYIGFPREIRADGQKSLLKSKLMKKFLKKHRVRPEIYPPYYKYHNASVERQIRNIRAILRTQNSIDQNFKWFKNLTSAMTVLNAIPRKFRHGGTTRFLSPFEIYFGRQRQLLKIDDCDDLPLNPQPTSLMAAPLRNFTRGAILALKNDFREAHNKKAREVVIKPGDFYLVQDHRTPRQGQIPLKYKARYLPNIFLCKKVCGKNVLGLDIILGNGNFSSLDNIKIYKSREDYFSLLPDPIKHHFGSSLDLKLSLDARKIILNKLQRLGMYTNIAEPAQTLSSPAPPSSSASGTLNPSMVDNNTNIPLSDNILLPIADNGLGSIVAKQSARPPIQRPDNVGKESNKNPMNLPSPPPLGQPQNHSPSESMRKEKIKKRLGRMAKYLNPFDPPPAPRKRKPPLRYQDFV